jgi:LacI family transcriptional regulator
MRLEWPKIGSENVFTWSTVVTLFDVARTAGVSASTVSRALTRPDKVAVKTRALVESAVDELGYVPNRAASGLRGGRTHTFGLLVPDLANPYFAAVAKGVAERAREHQLGVFVVDSDEDEDDEPELVRRLAHQTDGVVLCSPRAPLRDVEAIAGRPLVLINNRIAGVASVAVDNIGGIDLAVEHLRSLGHRRIAYVGGPEHAWSDDQRRAGLRRVIERRPELEVVLLGPHRPDAEGGLVAAGVVAASGCTAAITYNDLVAVGLVRRLIALGLRVPLDLSVVSFDDTILATMISPTLTSVRTNLRDVGRGATDLLVNLLDTDRGGGEPNPIIDTSLVLPAELVVRESTAPHVSTIMPGTSTGAAG